MKKLHKVLLSKVIEKILMTLKIVKFFKYIQINLMLPFYIKNNNN